MYRCLSRKLGNPAIPDSPSRPYAGGAPHSSKSSGYDNKNFSRGNTSVFDGKGPAAPRMLVFRDSFFNYILPHYIPVFSRTFAVSAFGLYFDLISAVRPDVVVFEVIERFVGMRGGRGERVFPTDPADSFEELSGTSLGELKAY